MTRRSWHERLLMFLSGVLGVGLGGPALTYLVDPSEKRSSTGWTDAGPLSDIPEDQPTELRMKRQRTDAWRRETVDATAWVVRQGNDVTAFSPQCTHLGCGYKWIDGDNNFFCPCHDTRFSKDGDVLSGVAPRPLDRYQVRVEDDRLMLGAIEKSEA